MGIRRGRIEGMLDEAPDDARAIEDVPPARSEMPGVSSRCFLCRLDGEPEWRICSRGQESPEAAVLYAAQAQGWLRDQIVECQEMLPGRKRGPILRFALTHHLKTSDPKGYAP